MEIKANKSTSTWAAWPMAAAATISPQPAYNVSNQMPQKPPQAIQATPPTSVSADAVIDLKIQLSEQRTETKFAQLMGKMDMMLSGLRDVKSDMSEIRADMRTLEGKVSNSKMVYVTTAIASVFAIVGLTYAAVQIFQSSFGLSAGAFQAGLSAQQQATPATPK